MPSLPLDRLITLQKTILSLHSVKRKVNVPGRNGNDETDTEHSYSLAMLAWFLSPNFPELSTEKLLKMSLVHDFMEVYSGDVFSYADQSALNQQVQDEQQAIEKLKTEWPDFTGMLEVISEYEACETPEAKFMHALDKLQPTIMDSLDSWRAVKGLGIDDEKYWSKKRELMKMSPKLEPYFTELQNIMSDL
jgi:putative hydrolases of HD superfamily